jgi:pimeloyl-ACP methyl ester carboxylesterase/predicted esterase
MRRATAVLAAGSLAVLLSACGSNNITDTFFTPTTTVIVPGTATATTAPTATMTSVPPTATPTGVPTATPSATQTTVPTPTPTAQAAMALFSADPMDAANPFPSDRLLDASGHAAVPPSYLDPGLPATSAYDTARAYVQNVIGQLHALTGFSTFAPILIHFDQPVAVDSGRNPPGILLLEYNDLAAPPPAITASVYDPDNDIEVRPVVPLQPKTKYAFVVTTALTDATGRPVRPSPDFAAVLSGQGLSPGLAAFRAQVQPVLDYMQSAFGIGPDGVALVDVFTTVPTTDDLVSIQQRLVKHDLVPGGPVFENSPINGLETGIFPEGSPQFESLVGSATSPNIAAVAVGSFDSYDFRTGPRGAFDPNLVAGPDVPPVNHLDFYVTIPKAPPPPGGYPITVFGHGLGGSGKDVISSLPPMIGDAPVMGIAISALQHGRRGMPTNFFIFNDIAATREFFRQTVADFMQLTRMVENAQAAGIAPFDMVDPNRIMYFGVSLGGIMGSMFMAVEPDVRVGMLSVPGGGLPNILASHDIGNLLDPLLALQTGIPQTNAFFPLFRHRFQHLAQWVLESADPIDYGPHIIVPGAQLTDVPLKHVLVHEGIVDNTIPNRTTDDLALATRLPDLNLSSGCADDNGCSGIWRFVMTDYGQPELSGHSVSFIVPQASAQVGEYLRSYGTHVPDASPFPVQQTSVSVAGSVPPPNPVSGASTPDELDRGLAQVYQSAGIADADIEKVLIMVPGFLGGAGDFDYLARRVVFRSQGKTAVWAVDRRSNLMEDQTGLDAAEATGNPEVAKNYYFKGGLLGGKSFAGFVQGSAATFESEWGIKTQIEDLDALVTRAAQRYPRAAIFLGGHSLGGAIVPIYAAWDFGGRAGFERLSGLVLLEGTPNPADASAIPRQTAYETTGINSGGGVTSLKALRTGSPMVSLPFIGPDLFVTAEILAMRTTMAPHAVNPDADLVRGFFGTLFGLTTIPAITNEAALGFGFDDDYEPLSFARVSLGSALGPVGPNPNAAFFGGLVGPDDNLLAPTDPTGQYDWQSRGEMPAPADPTDIQTFARMLFAGPSNFIEWYFPGRLTLDVGVTAQLNVQPTGDWRKDVYGISATENGRVDLPVFAVAADRGLVRDPAKFNPYRDSIAPTLRNGAARSAVTEGFEAMSAPGVHLDVLSADDRGAGNAVFGPLVAWMDTAAQIAPRLR